MSDRWGWLGGSKFLCDLVIRLQFLLKAEQIRESGGGVGGGIHLSCLPLGLFGQSALLPISSSPERLPGAVPLALVPTIHHQHSQRREEVCLRISVCHTVTSLFFELLPMTEIHPRDVNATPWEGLSKDFPAQFKNFNCEASPCQTGMERSKMEPLH